MRRVTKFAVVLTAASMTLAACGGGGDDSASGGGEEKKKTLKVGLAYDIGGRGDQSFNDAAAAGLEKVKKDLNLETKELSAAANETDADKEERLRLLADGGFNPILAVGFAYAPALGKVAKEFPETSFGIVDDASVKEKNVASLVFAEEQGSFLVGAAAALKSTKGSVGYIGGCEVPLLKKFEAGFTAGAKAAKPDIKVNVNYLSQPAQGCPGFNDPANGQETAKGMYDGGADVIYAAAGGSGSGVFKAAKAANAKAIGVDSDQYLTADAAVKDVVITSMLKRVDTAVFTFVESVGKGSPLTGEQRFDLSKDGVGYSTSGGFVDDIKPKLEEYKKQIIDGTIKVPTTPGA